MKNNLISVIVPVYNIEEFVERCIASICNQTYKNLQIILIDDGSEDLSGKICDDCAKKDARIIVIHQENQGLVCARKKGLEVAGGNYIGFVDGDDYIEPNMFGNLLLLMQTTGADLIHTGFFANDKVIIPEKYVINAANCNRVVKLRQCVLDTASRKSITPSIWSKLFKAEIIRKAYKLVPDNQSYGEDLLCLIACICEGNSIASVDNAYYHYRIRENSISHVVNIDNFKREIALYESIVAILLKYGLYEQLQVDVERYLKKKIIDVFQVLVEDKFFMHKYKVPCIDMLINKKIIIYGAGAVGRDYYSEISRYSSCKIVAWVDKNYDQIHFDCCEVQNVDVILNLEYDYILIANLRGQIADSIKKELIDDGIISNRIIWFEPQYVE